MQESYSDAYAQAGVDITAGYRAVELMREHVARTMIPGAGSVGGFGGVFEADFRGMEHPCLVSGTDGVGTKIRIAQLMNRHNTVGIDCVAMCVNDIICCGARPLFFLDYIAVGKNEPEKVASIVAGIADGCVEAGCALTGGETAEHPGMMAPDDYDIAGFVTGVVDRKDLLDGSAVRPGDVLVGLESSGLHSNGYSLVRRVFNVEQADLTEPFADSTLGEALLAPTKIYVKPVLAAIAAGGVRAAAHVTGGGLIENVPRCLPEGLEARIDYDAWSPPPVFGILKDRGSIDTRDMYNTFNMGIGMVLVCEPDKADGVIESCADNGAAALVVGEVAKRNQT